MVEMHFKIELMTITSSNEITELSFLSALETCIKIEDVELRNDGKSKHWKGNGCNGGWLVSERECACAP